MNSRRRGGRKRFSVSGEEGRERAQRPRVETGENERNEEDSRSGGIEGRGRRGRRGRGRGRGGMTGGGRAEERETSERGEICIERGTVVPPEEEQGGEASIETYQRRINILMEERNEMKKKLREYEGDILERGTCMQALTLQVKRQSERIEVLEAENESLRAVRREITAIPTWSRGKSVKGRMKLTETVSEQYLGIALQVDKMLERWCNKEVSEVEHFSEKGRRLWAYRGEDVQMRGIKVGDDREVAPYPPMLIAEGGGMYTASVPNGELALKEIVEEVLDGEAWQELKRTEEVRRKTIEDMSECKMLRMQLSKYLSECSSYRKRVLRDTLFSALKYDKLVSKNCVRTEEEKESKDMQVRVAKKKLMKRSGANEEYDMGWWRTCRDETLLMWMGAELDSSATISQDITEPVGGAFATMSEDICEAGSVAFVTEGDGTGSRHEEGQEERNEDGEEEEETYGLFRTGPAQMVWENYRKMMYGKVETC